jgi:hypothetical protein
VLSRKASGAKRQISHWLHSSVQTLTVEMSPWLVNE